MRALAKTRPEPGLEIIDAPIPTPGPGEVQLRIEAASVCGTDRHLYLWDRWAAENIQPPVILGHELAGRVAAVGSGVSRVREGDLVGVESHLFDGTCAQCRAGSPHLCRNLRVIGAHVDGGYAEFVVIPEANAVESNGLDPAVVALQEPMGNAVHAAFVEPIAGRTVAVTGCGPIGLCAVGIAKAAGAAWVVATDTEPYRLELATKMGADLVLDGREADTVERVLDATGGDGVEVVLEMSGSAAALEPGVALRDPRRADQPARHLRRAGGRGPVQPRSSRRGFALHGMFGRRIYDTWERTQDLLRSGALNVAPILTHRFDLAEYEKAFELLGSRHAGKVVLLP